MTASVDWVENDAPREVHDRAETVRPGEVAKAMAQPDRRAPVGFVQRMARRVTAGRLSQLRDGRLSIVDSSGTLEFGNESAELSASIEVRDPGFYLDVLLGGSLAAGEAYVRGDWDCDDLMSLFRVLTLDGETGNQLDGPSSAVWSWTRRLAHRLRANTRRGSRRNIEAHYDLGNEFFELMLDDTLAYSSGVFTSPTCGLREASVEKMDRICRKLDLQPADQVLEIGTGWGGWALHAAQHYGCRVTTTTISQRQYETARRRIDAAGLGDRITLLNADYRDLTGKYDKLVSIEMIEAVGHQYFDTFFGRCGELLEPHGRMALQCIVMPDRNYAKYLRSVDFIQRYVFPGGCLPSLGAIMESTARSGDLRTVHCEDFGSHYARTLAAWRSAFESRLADVRRLGYGEEFIRLWRYYLCYCQAAFEARYLGLVQLVLERPGCRHDPYAIVRAAAAATRQGIES